MKKEAGSENKPLPDLIDNDLKVVFIGFNPGLRSAETGHHYAGRSNRFWSLLYKSGLIPEELSYTEDKKLLTYGYGSVNIVDRPSRGAADLTPDDYAKGRKALHAKLAKYQPQIACYMGIGVYKQFSGLKRVKQGKQMGQMVPGVIDFVISSPSGLNRIPVEEQLEYYRELKTLVEHLR